MVDSKEYLLSEIRQHYDNNSIRLPSDIGIEIVDGTCKLTLLKANVTKRNMQDDSVCFESWSLVSYLSLNKKKNIMLCLNEELVVNDYCDNGHLCRFLYRIMKFSEQYSWFTLSLNLQEEVDKFKTFLDNNSFVNNIPTGEAENNDHAENIEEARLATGNTLSIELNGQLDIGESKVYRQLPVGLFKETVSKTNSVFTGGKSAIDLWSINDDTLYIYELKTENKMVGIVTEIFFYSNLMFDFFVENNSFNMNNKSGDCGYNELIKSRINSIKGVLLADVYHPLVNEELVDAMNDSNMDEISYVKTMYKH